MCESITHKYLINKLSLYVVFRVTCDNTALDDLNECVKGVTPGFILQCEPGIPAFQLCEQIFVNSYNTSARLSDCSAIPH